MEREVVRAIILNSEGRAFLAKRARGMGAGQWALIGGKPEGEESMEEAVAREVQEETGFDFQPVLYKGMVDSRSDPEDQPWHVYIYYGQVKGVLRLDPVENSDFIFVDARDLNGLDIAFKHGEILEEFFSWLSTASSGK